MTPEEFIAKFPKQTSVNSELLEDIACPECGQRDRFNINFTGQALVTEEGSEDVGDHEWDGSSSTTCTECFYGALLSDFRIKGLDDALDELEQVRTFGERRKPA